MQTLKIRRASQGETVPWKLLLQADPQRHEVQKYLERGELWVAEQMSRRNSTVVGEMMLLETHPDVWEVMNIAVAARLRGKGIGTSLLRKARTLAKQRKAHRLEVGTDNGAFRQLAFYQRFGFRIVAIDRDFFIRRYNRVLRRDGVPLRDMVRMSIELK